MALETDIFVLVFLMCTQYCRINPQRVMNPIDSVSMKVCVFILIPGLWYIFDLGNILQLSLLQIVLVLKGHESLIL